MKKLTEKQIINIKNQLCNYFHGLAYDDIKIRGYQKEYDGQYWLKIETRYNNKKMMQLTSSKNRIATQNGDLIWEALP